MGWADGRLLGFDLETTAPDPMEALPVSYALVLRRDAQQMSVNTNLVNPGVEIPQGAIDVHGITQERAETDGLPLAETMAWIKSRLMWAEAEGIPVTGMNVAYDLTIVHRLADLSDWHGTVLDVFVLDKQLDRYRKGKRTLSAICDHYGLSRMHGEAHDAKFDAVATIQVVLAMTRRHEWLGKRTLSQLHADQVKWAAEQTESLSEHFMKKGQDPIPEADRGWPIKRGALT